MRFRTLDQIETEEGDMHQQLLRGAGLKATTGRLALVQLLEEEKQPISVTDISKKLGKSISFTGVYRTLESLVEAGAVQRIDLGHTHANYEIKLGRKHHHHITCKKCGDMEDVQNCSIQKIETSIPHQTEKFESVYSHSLEFFGLCKKCA